MPRVTCTRREDVAAICPHCNEEIDEVFVRKPKGPFGIGQGYLFFCSSCRKVLGSSVQWYPFPART